MMIRIIGHGQNPQAASDAPRWHLTESGALALESGFDANTVEQLRALGHDILLNQPEHLFGGAQLIARHDTGYCAASDHRKEGIAAGF
jgi:gamma-glutamyltranspeptidase/glutathione hydrolase